MKRTQKYLSSEAHGYLREAEACSLVLKDLERISAKLQRRIDREVAARQADFEAAMQYHSEAEIQDAYGWEFITEAQYHGCFLWDADYAVPDLQPGWCSSGA